MEGELFRYHDITLLPLNLREGAGGRVKNMFEKEG
jgi:hypothetical protein